MNTHADFDATAWATEKPLVEDRDSWCGHLKRRLGPGSVVDRPSASAPTDADIDAGAARRLHHSHHLTKEEKKWIARHEEMEEEREAERAAKEERRRKKMKKKNKKHQAEMLRSSGVQQGTVHGMMIDAGSTGSRMHVYEFRPRVLLDDRDVEAAVSGKKLSFPGTETRWTERLSPGLGTFADLPDEKLVPAVAKYLSPLIEFAKDVLHTKLDSFKEFPIYLKATAGLRILSPTDRSRVIGAVRTLFANGTYCPFSYEEERVRVISGEEEAIYGWAGVNWLMGTLLKNSEGAGTVINPRLTFGALDLGGASAQISFYEPDSDVMSNLFKLQIGQGKHWNVYAHSFLRYGVNAAKERMGAKLAHDRSVKERLVDGVHNPCLPGGSQREFKSNIQFREDGIETIVNEEGQALESYSATFVNRNNGGDWDACSALARDMLHKEANAWCDFSHGGDCSFAGVYEPRLPIQSEKFGEFLGFSNYNHVFQFLKLPARSSLAELQNKARVICSMGKDELFEFNSGVIEEADVEDYCFHSAYAFNLLHNGYGFPLDYHITATNVVNGHKVDWALGAMLYEINTLPWTYVRRHRRHNRSSFGHLNDSKHLHVVGFFVGAVVVSMVVLLVWVFAIQLRRSRGRHKLRQYEPIKEVELEY